MRRTPEAIRQLLTNQLGSGQTVADFCRDNALKVATFYSWKRKHNMEQTALPQGFCQLTTKPEKAERALRLPSGLQVSLLGWSTTEVAELILAIERAHA